MPSIWHMLGCGTNRPTDWPGYDLRNSHGPSRVFGHANGPLLLGARNAASRRGPNGHHAVLKAFCLLAILGIVLFGGSLPITAAQQPGEQPAAAAGQSGVEQPAEPAAAEQPADAPAAPAGSQAAEAQPAEPSPAASQPQPAAVSGMQGQPAVEEPPAATGAGAAASEQDRETAAPGPTAQGTPASQQPPAVQDGGAQQPGKRSADQMSQQPPDQTGEKEAVERSPLRAWLQLLVAVLVVVGAVGIGNKLAKQWRMPDYANRLTIILLALFASVAITVMGWPPRRGIDLRGGVILVYEFLEGSSLAALPGGSQVQPTTGGGVQPVDVDKLVQAISRRINPGGVKEVTVRPLGERQIEIIIPEADREEVERIKRKVSAAGTLEFRILANQRDHAGLIEQALQSDRRELRGPEGNRLAWWVPVTKGQEESFASYGEIARRERADRRSGYTFTEILVVNDPFDVTGAYLVHSAPGYDRSGSPCVFFSFNSEGGQRFGGLTGKNRPEEGQEAFTRKLGIILDGYLYSAPAIKDTITTNGEITGRFTRQEVEDLVDVLNAGSLPTRLSEEPASENLVGPTLGRDTIRRGQQAIVFSMILVPLFMVFYYRFAGLVACFSLFLTLTLVLAAMITIKAAFTLAGLAGLVLTVGMAVDANVIIYERIREEIERGAALRMAIRNGFDRAMSAIVDGNLTTLITATVLYVIGRDQIKGFAVTLWLGVVMSMFAAIYCARVVFDVAERRRWVTRLNMLRLISNPRINFMSKAAPAMVVSCALILIGLVAVYQRGKGILDIDFTGGVSIQAEFVNPQRTADVRAKLGDQGVGLQDLAISDVQVLDDPTPGRRFLINTSGPRGMDPNASPDDVFAEVEKRLEEAFGKDLVHFNMQFEILPDEGKAAGTSGSRLGPSLSAGAGWGEVPAQLPKSATAVWGPAHAAAMVFAQADSATGTQQPDAGTAAQPPETARPEQEQETKSGETGPPLAAVATLARLHFEQPVVFETIDGMFRDAVEQEIKVGRIEKEIPFTLINLAPEADEETASTDWQVELPVDRQEAQTLLELVQARVNSTPYFPSLNTVGGAVAAGTRTVAIVAIFASLVFIVGYLWVRFQRVTYGMAAIVAVVHDVLVTLGAIAVSAYLANWLGFLLISEFKISLSVLAAFLTIIGYSLNDTIVVFDRIREVRGKSPQLTAEMINTSVNQTLSRTLLTSLTTLLVVIVLYVGGGQAIRPFTYSLLVGVVVGTYSSVFIAAPLLIWFGQPRISAGTPKVASKRSAA